MFKGKATWRVPCDDDCMLEISGWGGGTYWRWEQIFTYVQSGPKNGRGLCPLVRCWNLDFTKFRWTELEAFYMTHS